MSLWPRGIGPCMRWNRLRVQVLVVSNTYPMFIEPTISRFPSGFSGYIWLDIVFEKENLPDQLKKFDPFSPHFLLQCFFKFVFAQWCGWEDIRMCFSYSSSRSSQELQTQWNISCAQQCWVPLGPSRRGSGADQRFIPWISGLCGMAGAYNLNGKFWHMVQALNIECEKTTQSCSVYWIKSGWNYD